ncbi:unnamed protein product, partial [Rotaria socialis]
FGELTTTTTTTTTTSSSQLNIIQNECNSYSTTNVLFGFGAGIALIILLLLVNLIVMLSKKNDQNITIEWKTFQVNHYDSMKCFPI